MSDHLYAVETGAGAKGMDASGCRSAEPRLIAGLPQLMQGIYHDDRGTSPYLGNGRGNFHAQAAMRPGMQDLDVTRV